MRALVASSNTGTVSAAAASAGRCDIRWVADLVSVKPPLPLSEVGAQAFLGDGRLDARYGAGAGAVLTGDE